MKLHLGPEHFTHKTLDQWLLLSEAGCMLILARVALKTIPARYIVRWVRRPIAHEQDKLSTPMIETIRWAVRSFSHKSPIRLVCFPQAIAMHAMLRRRHITSEILYGVARLEDGKLVAHAWLQCRQHVWLGGEVSPAFTVLDTWKPSVSDRVERQA